MLHMSWNDGQCGLWILVNTAHYFPHDETIFIGHVLITHFLSVDVGYIIVYVLEVAVILQTLQKLSTWDSEVEVWG